MRKMHIFWLATIFLNWCIPATYAGEAKQSWQAQWEQTVRAAEQEGQVTVSIGGFTAHIDSGGFLKNKPNKKKNHTTSAGTPPPPRGFPGPGAGEKIFVSFYTRGGEY